MSTRPKRARWRWIEWETANFIMRPLKLRDVFDVHGCLQDPALTQYMYNTSTPTRFDVLKFILRAKWQMFRRTAIYYIRIYKPEKRIVCLNAVFGLDPYRPHNAEMGTWWVQDFWGHPLRRTEGRSGIWTVFIYDEVGIYRLVANINENNARAIRAMHRGSSRFEGVHRDDRVVEGGYACSLQWSSFRTNQRVQRRIADVKGHWGWPPPRGILDPTELETTMDDT